jgi:dual specificity tyrosine-phosphorylation-regulated kinase 2/3/4
MRLLVLKGTSFRIANNSQPVVHRSTSSGIRPSPHSRQVSNNQISSFNFGTRPLEPRKSIGGNSDAYPFLPAVNFDDFHTSITAGEPLSTNSQRLDSSLIGSTGRVTISNGGSTTSKFYDHGTSRRSTLAASEVRNGRNGFYVQRQTSITRPKAQSSASSTRVETMGPPIVPTTTKGRRQSHFPTSSTSSGVTARPPRKSIGPGTILTNSSEGTLLKGYSLSKPEANENEGNTLNSMDRPTRSRPPKETDSVLTGDAASFLSIRNAKAKSLHAPASLAQDYGSTSPLVAENLWSMPFSTSRSPGRPNDQGSATPSSSRRLSVMPGHITGLGARTISPTDARRLKRMSMMPNPPPLPHTPPGLLADPTYLAPQSSVESPSYIPRKSETPSSNRTTPDPNRKSYCSVVSISSSTSYNSIRGMGATPRLVPSASSSRLPTLKSRNENNVNANEEEVPPVPAIPKAYESPKSELDIPFFAPRKSSLTDAISLNSTSTVDHGGGLVAETDTQVPQRERHESRGLTNDNYVKVDEQTSRSTYNNIRNLQPLRLPPLNLLPLSTPTTDKIAALNERGVDAYSNNMTPPPRRGQAKTPSTPMTASKANFFSRNQYSDEYIPIPSQTRSSSSHYALRSESSLYQDASSSNSSVLGPPEVHPESAAGHKAISPFISSSLPKNSGDFSKMKSKASTERIATSTNLEHRPSRLTGPRAQTSTKNLILDANSQPSSPLESEAQSFGTSIRRKLSLTRKRSLSKSDITAERQLDLPPQPPKHDAMPPPRLPASATWNGPWLSNPSPLQKPNYLSSRRKASGPEVVPRQEPTRIEHPLDGVSDKKPALSAERSAFRQVSSRTPSYNGLDSMMKLRTIDTQFDRDDLIADEQMKQLALRRKDTESAARELDALRQRAVPKDKVSAAQALRTANLNIFERGEIVDYKEVYFCGTQTARKFAGDLEAEGANFGYDDERGDYKIVNGDHLAYRYEVVDILGKGSFGQVVRCVDHKTGGLVAIKIIRNKKRFHQQALVEVNILRKLREWVSRIALIFLDHFN